MDGATKTFPGAAPAERLHRGTNQSGMRDFNERLVLSLVRRHEALPKSEIARLTGLSAQTVSVIVRSLEAEGLLERRAPLRGRVGQPSVPMALKPDGALFLGLKIGRRSAELVLIDFVGRVRAMLRHPYRFPTADDTVAFVVGGVARLRAGLSSAEEERIAGLGIAMPFGLWNWADAAGAPAAALDEWRHRDMRADLQAVLPFPVHLENDATAACGAELVFGTAGGASDFIYFYVGAFAGGGVVLGGSLYSGRTGNAGALGSMPVPGRDGGTVQLIDTASIAALERLLLKDGGDASVLWNSPEDWGELGPPLEEWLETAARGLAFAIVSASAVIDFEAAVIDGWMPEAVRGRLVAGVASVLPGLDAEGLALPRVREGTVGIHARALGAASLPLSERFLVGPAALAKLP